MCGPCHVGRKGNYGPKLFGPERKCGLPAARITCLREMGWPRKESSPVLRPSGLRRVKRSARAAAELAGGGYPTPASWLPRLLRARRSVVVGAGFQPHWPRSHPCTDSSCRPLRRRLHLQPLPRGRLMGEVRPPSFDGVQFVSCILSN
uniref:Uncharacterized protein n=1 Tax=Oryza brachyantha TaxID=4533 RepID=J3M7S0_ORYBR